MKSTAARRRKVAVLAGTVSEPPTPDEEDSLQQAAEIADGLAGLGWDPSIVLVSRDLESVAGFLHEFKPVFAFNLVEAIGGAGRLLYFAPALLDQLGIPYTGARTEPLFTTSQKLIAKQLLAGAGIPTPVQFTLESEYAEDMSTPQCIIKHVWEHASIGMTDDAVLPAGTYSAIRQALLARTDSRDWFAEVYIEGREYNVAMLDGPSGPEVLPPAEMQFIGFPPGKPHIVGYSAKWETDSFEYANTVRTFDAEPGDEALRDRIDAIARACWKTFGLRGYARVDLRVDENGVPWVLEVNANPCLSHGAGFLAAADRAGLGYSDVLARIIAASGIE